MPLNKKDRSYHGHVFVIVSLYHFGRRESSSLNSKEESGGRSCVEKCVGKKKCYQKTESVLRLCCALVYVRFEFEQHPKYVLSQWRVCLPYTIVFKLKVIRISFWFDLYNNQFTRNILQQRSRHYLQIHRTKMWKEYS